MASVDHLFRVIVIGDPAVGKSSIVVRLADGEFPENYACTIGADFKLHTIEQDGKIVRLQIWDTAGQERFKSITTSYYRGAKGAILVYDITDRESFDNVSRWSQDLDRLASANVPKVLIGNKCDRTSDRQVTYKEGRECAEQLGCAFKETSAKSNEENRITEAFQVMATEMLRRVTLEATSGKEAGEALLRMGQTSADQACCA